MWLDIILIDAKTAVAASLDFIREMYGDNAASHTVLEEVEISDNELDWYLTFSIEMFPSPSAPETATSKLKIFRVSATNGEILSMTSPKERQT